MEFDSSSGEQHADFKAASTILKTPEQSPPEYTCRQNHVSNVVLHGIPIVSLRIDGKERLCLAQISNTLLKQFSYNEIHNRRVALGITCVQCTPVQLEILRRAGAMPISSRRCGMITKREAERLVKSFLEDNRPPKLPDNFYFEVYHNCGWGCKGKFEPSRYNSSRAKCIRCNLCNLYFSPNKFIFHFHRTAESKYNHPDAANFNSWRRHLHLIPGVDGEDVSYAWEDVKAMFNGGSRKRMLSSPGFPDPPSPPSISEPKRPKAAIEDDVIAKPNFPNQYQNYPLFSMPGAGKGYPFNPITTTNPLAFHYQLGKGDYSEDAKAAHSLAYNPWRQTTDFILPPYDLLWASQLNVRTAGNLSGYRQHFLHSSPGKDTKSTQNSLRQSPSETHTSSEDEEGSFQGSSENIKATSHRPSAFRPVGKIISSDDGSKDFDNTNEHSRNGKISKQRDEIEDLDVDVEDDLDETTEKSMSAYTGTSIEDDEAARDSLVYSPDTSGNDGPVGLQNENSESHQITENSEMPEFDEQHCNENDTDSQLPIIESSEELPSNNNNSDLDGNQNDKLSQEVDDLNKLSKEELQRLLKNEMDVRKQVEGDIFKIKKGLEEQVNKEKSQRDEISKQLQIMKDALCNELEQERKTRLSMQQKLKEAHDALHNFSCKIFNSKQHGDCSVKETMWQ